MMKGNTATLKSNTVLHALAKDVCPICTLVRAFQNELIELLKPDSAATVCNYHAWAIAAGAPASSVAETFLSMLRGSEQREVGQEHLDCDLCSSIREHELGRLREFALDMQRAKFAEWFGTYGTLCRVHGIRLLPMLSKEHVEIVAKVTKDNKQQLEELLESFAAKARAGEHSGGGILGRAAEFLVAQRGLTR